MDMALTPSKINTFTFFKLPSAWWCGVRLKYIDHSRAVTTVRYKWMNQNPFKSMFWAVQGMAAELSTGAMVMNEIQRSGKDISMLVAQNRASFTKKAKGRIDFSCEDGHLIAGAIQKAIETGEGQTVWMKSIGVNQEGVEVSTFQFEWSLKIKG